MQTGYPLLEEAPPPLAHRSVGYLQLLRNLQVGVPRSTQQNNLGSTHQSCRKGARIRQTFQLLALLRIQDQCRFRSSHRHKHLHCAREMLRIPSNTIATYLWDIILDRHRRVRSIRRMKEAHRAEKSATL